MELWHLGCIIRSMMLYYQNKCWNTETIPAGSHLSQEGLSTSLCQLQSAVFSSIIKNVILNLSIQSIQHTFLFFKGQLDLSAKHLFFYTSELHHFCALSGRVVVNDCFALSFLSTLDELRDCSIQTGRAVVISAVTPGSPDTEGRISIGCR